MLAIPVKKNTNNGIKRDERDGKNRLKTSAIGRAKR
jgi:hypothetical protein